MLPALPTEFAHPSHPLPHEVHYPVDVELIHEGEGAVSEREASWRPPSPMRAIVDLTPSWVYREQTGFFACYDVIHHTLGFLPLGDVRTCVGVCRFWEGIARERLGGRAEEIRQFVRVYNETVEERVVRESMMPVAQYRKALLLFFSLNTCPLALLPWLYLKFPYEWPWCISDFAFDIYFGLSTFLTLLVGGAGIIRSWTQLDKFDVCGAVTGYFVVATAVTLYSVSQRYLQDVWQVHIIVGMLTAALILIYSLPLLGGTGMLLGYYLYSKYQIHRQQIRNPLSDAPEDNGGGYFARYRKVLTLESIEWMMDRGSP